MGWYIFVFVIPALVGIGVAKLLWPHELSPKEMLIQMPLTVLVFIGIFVAGDLVTTGDTKLVNGEVTRLEDRRRMCPVGWVTFPDSHCTNYITRQVKTGTKTCYTTGTGSSKTRHCTDDTRTEYNYIYSWETRYFVDSTVKNFEISRVDPQGARVPERFSQAYVGEPVTVEQFYKNYIAAASHSLFNSGEALDPVEISYPRVRDYYRVNRVLTDGWSNASVDLTAWNRELSKLNRDIRSIGANAVILLTSDPSSDWSERLAKTWEAHNINDLVVVIGMDGETGTKVRWADVRSWSDRSLVNIEIRDAIIGLDELDPAEIIEIIRASVTQNYKLKSMDDFEYLAEDIPPPLWALILAFIGLLIVTPFVSYLFITRIEIR